MAEKVQFTGNDHSTQMLSGGAMSVENVNVVKNSGHFNTDTNASTSTFNVNMLDTFLKYPTVLFDGTINSTMAIGTTIYQTNVSPSLLNSTSLTRISNFASNFRQWTGSMSTRLIFTKPIFVQTKVIAAFIPGATIENSHNLTISDMYGAQYHVVMNPDNDNELEFKIPFISGVNWLNMEDSTGLFIIKLFQPLIASQPTGVANVSIPFTITLSSNCNTTVNGEKLMPLNFRYLIAPSYRNQNLANDFKEIIANSISPQIKDISTNKYAGYIPNIQTDGYVAKTLIFMPKKALASYIDQSYTDTSRDTGFLNTPNSIDSSRDLMFTNSRLPIVPPFAMAHFTNHFYVKVEHTFPEITYDLAIPNNTYTGDYSGSVVVLLFSSSQQVCEVGAYLGSTLTFTKTNGNVVSIFDTVTAVVSRNQGFYNYYVHGLNSMGGTFAAADEIDFTAPITFTMKSDATIFPTYQAQRNDMHDIVQSDRGNPDSTHFALFSTSDKEEVEYQIRNGNFSNLYVATQDQMAASFADRALSTSSLVSGDSGIERVDFISILMAIKIGVDVVAKASRVLSDVLTYLIPVFQANGSYVSPNQVMTFDLTGPSPTYYEIDRSRSSADQLPPVTNAQINVFSL